jgi:hypothetical protein
MSPLSGKAVAWLVGAEGSHPHRSKAQNRIKIIIWGSLSFMDGLLTSLE